MKKNPVLQYLSTASDTFLVIAFASLIATPIAISLAAQPVVQRTEEIAAVETRNRVQNQYALNNTYKTQDIAQITPTNSSVLGLTDVLITPVVTPTIQSILQNVNAKFETNDAKKLTADSSSSTTGEYKVTGSVKAIGTYNVLTLTNNNETTPVKLDLEVKFTDAKSTAFGIKVGNQSFTINKTDATKTIPTIVLNPKTQVTITLNSANAKQLGGYGITAKLTN